MTHKRRSGVISALLASVISVLLGCVRMATGNHNTVDAENKPQANVIGAWVCHTNIACNGKEESWIVLMDLRKNGGGGIGFIDSSGTDFPFVGKWKREGDNLVITADPDDYPELKGKKESEMTIHLLPSPKGTVGLDMASLLAVKASGVMVMHPATKEERDRYFGCESGVNGKGKIKSEATPASEPTSRKKKG